MNKESVQELLTITHRTMHYTHCKENFGNVPRREFFVMTIISDFCRENNNPSIKGISVTHIANILFSATANTSKLLRNMEDKGYLMRIFDDNDRRAVYICLTPKGEEMIANARGKTEERFMKIFEKMGEEEANEYLRLSRKLFDIIQAEQTKS